MIGPNGAGKTTLLNLVSGFQQPDAGTVRVGSERDHRACLRPDVAHAGLARTFQTAQPFGNLSVLDNVRLGLLRGAWRGDASPATWRARCWRWSAIPDRKRDSPRRCRMSIAG